MRTKHIFSAFVLGALAVACTNEEFETMGKAPELSNRVEIGNVTLALGGDEANTRFEVGPEFNDLTAVLGDEVGACLIDAPNTVFEGADYKKDAKYGYNITNYISTNYSFKFNGNAWNSEAKMVEGNYMFYAPYNPKHATRASITAKLNPVQQLEKDADGAIDALSTIKELKESGEVMAVSHVFINAADSKTVTTNLLPIYAYPLITLKNSYEPTVGGKKVPTDLVINQVVISKTDGFTTENTFKFAGNNETAISASEGLVNKLADFSYVDKDDNDKVKKQKGLFIAKNGSEAAYTADLLNGEAKTASAIVVKVPEGAYTLKAGEKTEFHVVIPAAAYTSGTALTIAVYTNKGVFEKEITDGSIAAGKRYPQSEYNPDGSKITPSEAGADAAGDTYTVDIVNMDGSSAAVVASTADLATLITNTNPSGEAPTLEVSPLNTSVQVNAAVMNAIKAKSYTGFTVKFTAPVTIATSISTNKTVEFAAGAEIAEGNITLGKGAKFSTAGKTLNIKGGTVTIEGAVFTDATIENNGGTVTVKSKITSLENKKGSVSVPNAIEEAGSFTNNGGTMTIGDGEKLPNGNAKTFDNNATFSNTKGTLEITANTVVSKAITENSATETVGIINNYGKATVTANAATGIINNYNILTATNNAGLIVMASAGAEVTVSQGTEAGRIKNNVDATVINTTGAANQVVYYEFTENVNGMLVPQAGIYNTIVLNGMTWSPSANQKLNVKVEMQDATISVYTQGVTIDIKDMHIVKTEANGSKSVLKGNQNSNINVAGEKITGDDGAELVVSNIVVKEGVSGESDGTAVESKTFEAI